MSNFTGVAVPSALEDVTTLVDMLAFRAKHTNLLRRAVDLSAWTWRDAVLPMLDRSGDRLVARYALPNPSRAPTVMLIHGLGGSADSTYVRAAARAFLAAGHPVLRLDLRGAGASRPLCALMYHAGRTQDLADALAALPDFVVGEGIAAMGFSLGANMLLKYLAEQGEEGPVRCAVSVSAPLDLAATIAAMLRARNAALPSLPAAPAAGRRDGAGRSTHPARAPAHPGGAHALRHWPRKVLCSSL